MKQLPGVVLKWCAYIGVSLCSLCVPSGFGVRAGLQVNVSHIFPQEYLAAVTLVGGKTEDKGTRARARCELMLPVLSGCYHVYA